MKKILLFGVALLFLTACWDTEDEDNNTSAQQRDVYENQDRNAPCWETTNCIEGRTCVGATESVAGTCQIVCVNHSDCGNGFLCSSGSCQTDCAGIGEKCSDRRICCFHGDDGSRVSDAVCQEDEAGNKRCLVAEVEEVVEGTEVYDEYDEYYYDDDEDEEDWMYP